MPTCPFLIPGNTGDSYLQLIRGKNGSNTYVLKLVPKPLLASGSHRKFARRLASARRLAWQPPLRPERERLDMRTTGCRQRERAVDRKQADSVLYITRSNFGTDWLLATRRCSPSTERIAMHLFVSANIVLSYCSGYSYTTHKET